MVASGWVMVAGGDYGFAGLGWLVVTVSLLGLYWFVFVYDFGGGGLGGGGGGGGGCDCGWWLLWL